MPVLTKNQVLEAAFELSPEEREEVAERIFHGEYELTEEQMNETRRRIIEHQRDPSTAISREELMASLRRTA